MAIVYSKDLQKETAKTSQTLPIVFGISVLS